MLADRLVQSPTGRRVRENGSAKRSRRNHRNFSSSSRCICEPHARTSSVRHPPSRPTKGPQVGKQRGRLATQHRYHCGVPLDFVEVTIAYSSLTVKRELTLDQLLAAVILRASRSVCRSCCVSLICTSPRDLVEPVCARQAARPYYQRLQCPSCHVRRIGPSLYRRKASGMV